MSLTKELRDTIKSILVSKWQFSLKSGSNTPKKLVLFASMKTLQKLMKNVYCFILKAISTLKIFKCLY